MTSHRIYTRRIKGLDKNVWLVLLVFIVLPIGLLSYRLIKKDECVPVNFTFRSVMVDTGNIFQTEETILFKTAGNADAVTWDFGDHSSPVNGLYVDHKYTNPGDYFVKANSASGCETIKKIVIQKAQPVTPVSTDPKIIMINGPGLTITGKENIFTAAKTASSYEWTYIPGAEEPQTGPSAKFIFPSTGKYFVQLVLNHDPAKKYVKEIQVKENRNRPTPPSPLPTPGPGPVPVPVTTLFVSDEVFQGYMTQVVDGKKFVSNFDAYLCSKGSTTTILNGGSPVSFEEACKQLNGKRVRRLRLWTRAVKITRAHLTRNQAGCVTQIEIDYN